MKLFFPIVSALLALLGAAWLVLPGTMLARWGVDTDAIGILVSRRYGALLIGYAAILWLARASGPSTARTAILGGGALVTALVAVLSVAGIVTGAIGPGAWVSAVIEALLAVGFARHLFTSRSEPEAKRAA